MTVFSPLGSHALLIIVSQIILDSSEAKTIQPGSFNNGLISSVISLTLLILCSHPGACPTYSGLVLAAGLTASPPVSVTVRQVQNFRDLYVFHWEHMYNNHRLVSSKTNHKAPRIFFGWQLIDFLFSYSEDKYHKIYSF